MTLRKILLLALVTLLSLLYASIASTAPQEFLREYTWLASELDSKTSCRTIAVEQAKTLLFEDIASYLERDTETKNFLLNKNKIIALTAGMVQMQVLEEKWDGRGYWLRAQITVNPDEMRMAIARLLYNREKTTELEESRKEVQQLLLELERLRKESNSLRKNSETTHKQSYDLTAKKLRARDSLEKGMFFMNLGENQKAIDFFSKAIELDPLYARAYFNRALAYYQLQENDRALRDCNRAIELQPGYAKFYTFRAYIHNKLSNRNETIEDWKTSARLGDKKAQMNLRREGIRW